MIVLDTSVLIPALGTEGPERGELRALWAAGERIQLPALVVYEYLRGPRLPAELAALDLLFPESEWIPFGAAEARRAAELYRGVPRARGRELDLAIAACALEWSGRLWTSNGRDFDDLPELRLHALP